MGEDISKKVGGEQEFPSRRDNYPLPPEEFNLKIKDLVEPMDMEGLMRAYKKVFAIVSFQNS